MNWRNENRRQPDLRSLPIFKLNSTIRTLKPEGCQQNHNAFFLSLLWADFISSLFAGEPRSRRYYIRLFTLATHAKLRLRIEFGRFEK